LATKYGLSFEELGIALDVKSKRMMFRDLGRLEQLVTSLELLLGL
jgi:hypothetical protein